MKNKTNTILQNTFHQLLIVYTLLIILISLGLFSKYTIQTQVFAIIIGTIGISIIPNKTKEEKQNKKIHYLLLTLGLILVLTLRVIPYTRNSIPLGYDAGIYKYAIDYGLINMDNWMITSQTIEPGFLYLMEFLKIFFSSDTILIPIFIFFNLILALAVYLATKEYSNEKAALISVFVFAFSLIQFKTFWYLYYKNIIGIILILFSTIILRKYEKTKSKKQLIAFSIITGLTASIHRPSFYIFCLSYLVYAITSPYQNKKYNFSKLAKNTLSLILILITASLFYLGKFSPAITSMFEPVINGFLSPGESSGTFINFFTYQFSSLFYLPFAIIGLAYFIKRKDFNILTIWAATNLTIVYLQFFFFNRFIIFLDVILIILSSIGFYILLENKKTTGKIILILLLLSASYLSFQESIDSKPLITNSELTAIKQLQTIPQNAIAMSTSSYYSPWILGYSNRKTVAPGLFDDPNSKEEWIKFWETSSIEEAKNFMKTYDPQVYIFIGEKSKDNLAKFPECFIRTYELEENKIYKFTC